MAATLNETLHAPAVALVLARYLIGMLVVGTAVLWLAAYTYLNKARGARPWALRTRAVHQAGCFWGRHWTGG